jgi:subtilisin family serine protease
VLFLRILFIAGAVVASTAVTAASVSAGEPNPAAIVVNSADEAVAYVERRANSDEVFERLALSSPGQGLRLEYVYRAHGTVPNPPNDPLIQDQWNFARVDVQSSWAHTDGSGVVIAVLDSAINFTGVDGFCTSIVSPFDAIRQKVGIADLNTTSEFGHGTHVAGTIAQCTNNGTGVAGVAPGVTLMPVRVLSNDGSGTSTALAGGIDWAVNRGADIINLSLGAECEDIWPTCNDAKVDAAISRAKTAGVLLVASSGNRGSPQVSYPAAHPNVVAVGAVDASDAVWRETEGVGSNQGTALDLVAPGVGIIQETTSFGAYDYYGGTGTSMAAPHVAAAAALILSLDPSLTGEAIVSILRDTALDIGTPGFDTMTGWGRIAVGAAVAAALPPDPSDDSCSSGPCDTIASVDAGGLWKLWERLHQSASAKEFYFGNPGDFPFMGDWDGDGEATPGLYRQSDGFVYLRDSNTQGNADLDFFFGNPGDVPLVGDFNGDGLDSVSIWRPSQARVFVINELGADGEGLGAADFDFYFGNPGDTPFVGDFDGDGIDTIGLHRESTGFVYLSNTLTTGAADLEFFFGDPGDQIIAGDWDGDGDDTVGVYRPSTGWLYINLANSSSAADWQGYIGSYASVVTAGNG